MTSFLAVRSSRRATLTVNPSSPLRRLTELHAALLPVQPKLPCFLGSSHGVYSKITSPPTSMLCVHSRLPEARILPNPCTFRPCRSSRLRRFTPHCTLRVCCTPLPTMRFTWFYADRRPKPTPDTPPGASPFGAFPSRSVRTPSQHRINPTPSPKSYPLSSLSFGTEIPPHATTGSCPSSSPLSPVRVATNIRLVTPMGFLDSEPSLQC